MLSRSRTVNDSNSTCDTTITAANIAYMSAPDSEPLDVIVIRIRILSRLITPTHSYSNM